MKNAIKRHFLKKANNRERTYSVVGPDGSTFRLANGMLAKVRAWTPRAAKHTIRRMFGEGFDIGLPLD